MTSLRIVRLVATDLDGTVVGPDGSVSARTAAALRAVEAAGAHLVLVTGRPARWLPEVVEQIGHTGMAVCANGALVFDLRTDRVVRSRPLSAAAALEVVARIRAARSEPTFAVETVHGLRPRPRVPAAVGRGPRSTAPGRSRTCWAGTSRR